MITVPYVIFRFYVDPTGQNPALVAYAISAALITCGIGTCLQVSKLPVPFTQFIFKRQMYLGTGVLSVMGTSFTFLPIYQVAIGQQVQYGGVPGTVAYGNMLGTSMACALIELFISIMPLRFLKAVFPQVVTSITVMLIGAALTGEGMKTWGGGDVCAQAIWKQNAQLDGVQGVPPDPSPICINGEVALGFGSSEFIGLGFVVIVSLVFIELFGSVFMK